MCFPLGLNDVPRVPSFIWMDIKLNVEKYKRREDRPPMDLFHIGEHYENLLTAMVGNPDKFREDLTYIKRELQKGFIARISEKDPTDINIGFMCENGRHRSVAMCRLVLEVLTRQGFTRVNGPVHLDRASWTTHQCTDCELCDPQYSRKQQLYNIALERWTSIAV